MSSLIPPPLSSTPPPILGPLDEDDDDEFGDFRAAEDSYDCDDFSLPPSPQKSSEKEIKSDFAKVNLDINSNNSQKITTVEMPSKNFKESVDKDFQDRRKSVEDESSGLKSLEIEVNCSNSQSVALSNIFDTHNGTVLSEDQIVDNFDERPTETESDQISEITKCSNIEDEFSDLQSGVPSSILINCDEIEHDVTNVEISDKQGLSNENLFEDFSESIHFEKTNSDDLSELNETNEIKSEDDYLEEINFEITDKLDNPKEINCENTDSLSLKVSEIEAKLSDDEFGDFEDHFPTEAEDQVEKEETEDEFDDFVSPLPPPHLKLEEDEDFGDFESSDLTKGDFEDFGDFSSNFEQPVLLEIDTKNACEKSEIILKEIFPVVKEEIDEFVYFDDTKGSIVFEELKDVTETNALIYQWSKSNSQKMFLKALNIDMRNILYGPAWHSSMPRFAANLGMAPLEPVKSEILTPTPVRNVSSPSNSSQKNNSDIPTAQFDWSGSGLINPLDSTSTELPGNVPEDSRSQVKTDFLPNISEKSASISSLFETDSLPKPKEQPPVPETVAFELPKPPSDQSDDFSPFQSPKMMIPLRETHISNEMLNDCGIKPGWLEPTILTPDLPRKEPVMDPEDEDDEFDDFQMVLPEESNEKTDFGVKTNYTNPLPDLSEFDITSKLTPPVNITPRNQEHIFATSTPPISLLKKKEPAVNNQDEDDEFTDFHSSLPQNQILKPVTPLQPVPMELLKPSVQYTTPVNTQINWPDPGVTDEDIRNIELSYSRKTEVESSNKTKSETKKESSLEDDEWTDFVSVTNPVKSVLPERTSTPDLPLSVLNLNHVQAPKQPIPVITPAGLVQTKLSTNPASNVVQTSLQQSLFRPPPMQFQPSIISNQYAANMFQQPPPSQDDDDDWSEFVSSQPISNGYQQKTKTPPMNWTSATTNIIMNPTHFDSLSYAPPQNKKATPSRNIPSISAMPDLDFIAPKNRTKK